MKNGRQIHIVGAGMAGLSAALQLSLAGEKVTLYEAAPFAGGRCRSFHDRELDCRIDNGNHLVLSGNVAIHDYLFLTNALETMGGPGVPIFPFADIETGERWVARMSMGRMPWWVFDKTRRVAGTKPKDYLSILKLMTAGENDVIADVLKDRNNLYYRFWEPMVIGVLNTEPEIASAQMLANVFAQSFAAGGRSCIPLIPKQGLSETFVTPCLEVLGQHEAEIRYNHRLRKVDYDEQRIHSLDFNGTVIDIEPNDWVIFALPVWVMRELMPEISVPTDFRSIVSAHFRVEVPANAAGFTGIIGGISEWAFVRNDVVSVTISCAERFASLAVRDMAGMIWHDLARLYDLDPDTVPPYRIFKEKYATFAATPEQNALRPSSYAQWSNMALAGEWTATGLPSTIEGSDPFRREGFAGRVEVERVIYQNYLGISDKQMGKNCLCHQLHCNKDHLFLRSKDHLLLHMQVRLRHRKLVHLLQNTEVHQLHHKQNHPLLHIQDPQHLHSMVLLDQNMQDHQVHHRLRRQDSHNRARQRRSTHGNYRGYSLMPVEK